MFDLFTGWKISVERVDGDGAYIIVPMQQVGTLCRVLADHDIPHEVEAAVPTRHHAEMPSEPVIRLGLAVEVACVQDILDREP